jgi:hypothetical protein
MDTLEILNSSGHISVTWDPKNPAEVANAKKEIAALKAAGYSFFAVVGVESDEAVDAGEGRLIVERIEDPTERPPEPEPVVSLAPAPAVEASSELPPEKRRRGRPSGSKTTPKPEEKPGRRNIAMRPLAGG